MFFFLFFFNILAVSYLAVEEDSSFLLLMIYWSRVKYFSHILMNCHKIWFCWHLSSPGDKSFGDFGKSLNFSPFGASRITSEQLLDDWRTIEVNTDIHVPIRITKMDFSSSISIKNVIGSKVFEHLTTMECHSQPLKLFSGLIIKPC